MVIPLISAPGGRVLSTAELRQSKLERRDFAALPRQPVTVLLDRVTGNYNIGAIFRLCDAFRVERLKVRKWASPAYDTSLPRVFTTATEPKCRHSCRPPRVSCIRGSSVTSTPWFAL